MTQRETTLFNGEKEDIIKPVWWVGWNPKATIVGIILLSGLYGYSEGDLSGFVVKGTVIGVIGWVASAIYINFYWEDLKDAYLGDVRAAARNILDISGEDVDHFSLIYKKGELPFVNPSRLYKPTYLMVGDSSVTFYEDAYLSMEDLEAYIGENTREFFYDQITGVHFNNPYLEIKTSTGDTIRFESSSAPDDALNSIQNRLRQYKSATMNTN